MISENDIFKKSVDVDMLLRYIIEKQYSIDECGCIIKITGIMLNPEALKLVVMDERVRGIGLGINKLGGVFKLFADNSLSFNDMRFVF